VGRCSDRAFSPLTGPLLSSELMANAVRQQSRFAALNRAENQIVSFKIYFQNKQRWDG
jgi:hypothetical protein